MWNMIRKDNACKKETAQDYWPTATLLSTII